MLAFIKNYPKFVIFSVLCFLLAADVGFSRRGGRHGGWGGWGGHRSGGHHGVVVRCSPNEIENNLVKTERIFGTLMATELYRNSEKFQDRLISISLLDDNSQKVRAYFQLLNVDADNGEEVLTFIFARDHAVYQKALMEQLDLNEEQAAVLIEAIVDSYKKSLQ